MRLAFALLLFAAPVYADHGYTWNGQHWQYSDGSLWNRTWVPGSTYTYCGRCYSTAGYYSYSYAGVYKAPVAASYDDDAAIIAKAVAARDAIRSRITESEYRHQRLLQSIKAANLTDGLGPLPGLAYNGTTYTGSALYGTFGVNTSTIYGYQPSVAQYISPFNVNLDQYFLAAAQLAQGSTDAAREANQQFNISINNAAAASERLSTIAARRDAVVAFARLLDGPPVATNTQYQFTVGPGGKISAQPQEVGPAPRDAKGLQERWNQSAQKCAACHFGTKLEGGFDVSTFPAMNADQSAKVLARLLMPKANPKHMPKDGDPLSPEEFGDWAKVAAFAAQPQAATKQDFPKK